MAEDHRELAVIMLTDIVGYTALAQQDESLALELLAEHNHLLRESFTAHDGREIKCTGDGFLVLFESPVQTVECALDIQSRCEQRNAGVDSGRAFLVRIGIHLGDIVHRGQDVFGDGVNVTSRIEPLAEPGGICISRQVHDQVWNKVSAKFASLGRKELKNLRFPIEVFRVTPSTMGKPVLEQDRTRIAVLPLVNISPDSSDAYFADGMTEELIYTLSKVSDLHVIANTSSMRYKNSDKSVTDIGQELRVGSVLEGSVRKVENMLRITVQLIDVGNEEHIWSERYDRELEGVFAIQGDIARRVTAALKVQLLVKEETAIRKEEASSPEAHVAYMKGRVVLAKRTHDAYLKAIECFEEALAIAPDYARAFTGLADTYSLMVEFISAAEGYEKARVYTQQALALDPACAEAHATLGYIIWQSEGDVHEAESEFLRAIELNPSYALAHEWYAGLLVHTGRVKEACQQSENALSLDPLSAPLILTYAESLHAAGRLGEAVDQYQKALGINPELEDAWWGLWWSLVAAWDWDRAEAITRQTVKQYPDNACAYVNLASCVMNRGRLEEGLVEIRKALALAGDPKRTSVLFHAGIRYHFARDYDTAVKYLRQTLERDPFFYSAHHVISKCYTQQERYEEALEEIDAAVRVSGGADPFWQTHVHMDRGRIYARRGETEKAENELAALMRSSDRQNRCFAISRVLADLGRLDEAMDWLEAAATARERHVDTLRAAPDFDVLRSHPRFQALLKRIGLAD